MEYSFFFIEIIRIDGEIFVGPKKKKKIFYFLVFLAFKFTELRVRKFGHVV